MMGECLYCRDGQIVPLYRVVTAVYTGGDFVPDDEWVCRTCEEWLEMSSRRGSHAA